MKIYILTKEINDYYQEGHYFIKAFKNKPTYEEVFPFIKVEYHMEEDQKEAYRGLIDHGGGRMGTEWGWFYLEEVEI